ncbi:hypothetical protein FOA43_003552 [Brettanomyces nanus]|uniref:Uncharacterized protein n=1 Tax=Eeniella nana TaxID=13502 RepID=A0A875S4D3_EENNA|nr:uncharacterized protein FOA43_003552 [Brettanomyces nanus]QPG76166.1 hypothetical protein FOA43_003552 [Brettanomyces nanus]
MNVLKGFAEDFAADKALDNFNQIAVKQIKTKDPYRETLPDGSTKKLKLPSNATKKEQKSWKKIQRRAWLDDRCFMGCYPVDCGCGLGPLAVIIPVIGPYLMYLVHAKLVKMAIQKFDLDTETQAKLHANILFDLLITLPPIIGSFFSWLNGCSTRNAAIIHTYLSKELITRSRNEEPSLPNETGPNNQSNSFIQKVSYYVKRPGVEPQQSARQDVSHQEVPRESHKIGRPDMNSASSHQNVYYPSSNPYDTYTSRGKSSSQHLRKPPPSMKSENVTADINRELPPLPGRGNN